MTITGSAIILAALTAMTTLVAVPADKGPSRPFTDAPTFGRSGQEHPVLRPSIQEARRKTINVDGLLIVETSKLVRDRDACKRFVDAGRRAGGAIMVEGAASDPDACANAEFPVMVRVRTAPRAEI